MNVTLIATFAGLVTAIGWGTSDFLGARAARKLRPIQISLVTEMISLAIAIVLLASFGLHAVSLGQVVRIVAYSITLNGAYLIFLKALAKGAVGIVVPLSNTFALFTLLLTIAFHQAHFTVAEFLAMLLVIVGAVILAYEKNHQKIPLRELHRETILTLISAIIWGISFFILNPIVPQLPWQTITVISELLSVIMIGSVFIIVSRGHVVSDFKSALKTRAAYLNGWASQLGMLAFYFGSHEAGNVVIPTVLSACGPLVASLWGRLFDNERIGWAKRAGALLVVIGVIAINAS